MRTCRLAGHRVPSRRVPMSTKKEAFDFDEVSAEEFRAARPLREKAVKERDEAEAKARKTPIFRSKATR